ncbi:MAG TPA: acyloxyacyl hydrolase [Terriglobales bacterium]|nr:acyloxyacyl hydrolase [Terriglobales bacterium]
MNWITWVLRITLLLAICPGASLAQGSPQAGGHEFQMWVGGGPSVAGGTSNTSVFNAGLRYGWVLTEPHGPGFLKGSFEYAVDGIPVFLIFQPANTAYGVGVNPLGLKWNFVPRAGFIPYVELGGGTLFTTHDVPTGTSSVNFTSGAALGTHVEFTEINWNIEVRYMHISNAGLASRNPGINTIQVRLGLGGFSEGRRARRARQDSNKKR